MMTEATTFIGLMENLNLSLIFPFWTLGLLPALMISYTEPKIIFGFMTARRENRNLYMNMTNLLTFPLKPRLI
jgi:hypothetical protein